MLCLLDSIFFLNEALSVIAKYISSSYIFIWQFKAIWNESKPHRVYSILFQRASFSQLPNVNIAFLLSVWWVSASKVKNFGGPIKITCFQRLKKMNWTHKRFLYTDFSPVQLDFHKHCTEYALFSRHILDHMISCKAWFWEKQGSMQLQQLPVCHTPQIQWRCTHKCL